MKALISPHENNRIVEVKANSKTFHVAEPLHWIDCPPNCTTEWKYEDGQFIEQLQPEPVIPLTVSMRQARLALLESGLLEQVNNAVQSGGEADKITWEYAAEVNREDLLVRNLSAALGLTEQHLDDLFRLAATL